MNPDNKSIYHYLLQAIHIQHSITKAIFNQDIQYITEVHHYNGYWRLNMLSGLVFYPYMGQGNCSNINISHYGMGVKSGQLLLGYAFVALKCMRAYCFLQ